MGSIQFYDDKILFEDGKIAFHEDCCCDGTVFFGECDDCCDDIPEEVRIYVSCPLFYREFDAERSGDSCIYVAINIPPDSLCSNGGMEWCSSGNIVESSDCFSGAIYNSGSQCAYPIDGLIFELGLGEEVVVSVGPATGEDDVCEV